MRKYEVMYILNASLEDAVRQSEIESIHEIITSNGGTIVNVDDWGIKELAYRIDDMTKGHYVVTVFEADTAALNEFTRLMRINRNVVRFMAIKQEA